MDFLEFAKNWPGPVVIRADVERFSGGLITARSLMLAEGRGDGPARVKVGKRVAYPKVELASWLAAKATK